MVTQFLLFFARDNVVISFLGLNWGLKQAQWTSIVLFLLLLPVTYLVFRSSQPVPVGEVAATYGISQPPEAAKLVKEGRPASTRKSNSKSRQKGQKRR